MPDKLKDDLDKGHALATALVEHVEDMGAACCTMPVVIDNRHYVVTVTKIMEAT